MLAGDTPVLVHNCTPGTTNGGPGVWEAKNEAMSARAAAYQQQVSGCGCGNVYRVNGVAFDGYANGTLLDAKGLGYDSFIGSDGNFKPWFQGADEVLVRAQK